MPLTATFVADFTAFIKAAQDATTTTEQLEAAAGKVGATMDQMVEAGVESAGKVGAALDTGLSNTVEFVKKIGGQVAEFAKSTWQVLNSKELKAFASDVAEFASGYIKEFSESEAATARLGAAVKNLGLPPSVVESYGQMAENLQKVTTFSDDAITEAQTLLTSIGRIGPEAMEPTLKATMDLASGLGIDLVDAAKLVARASASGGDELGKLKGVLGDNVEKGTDFAGVMAAINKQFGGSAAAEMETTAGQMKNLKNQMSDVNELIGQQMAENLKKLNGLFHAMPEGIQTFVIAAVSIGSQIAPLITSFGALYSSISALAGAAGFASVGAAIVALLPWFAAIAAAVAAVYFAWKYWDDIVAWTKRSVDAVLGFLKSLWDGFTQTIAVVKAFVGGIKDYLVGQLTGIVDYVVGLPGKVIAGFKGMYDAVVGHSYVPDMIDGIEKHFGRLDAAMVQPTLRAIAEMDRAWNTAHGMGRIYAGAGGSLPGYSPDRVIDYGWGQPVVDPEAMQAQWGRNVNVSVNMSGMLDTDDPQTRARVSDLVSNAVMSGMRNGRLLGTA